MVQFIETYRHLIYYIIGISVLRGLVIPGFNHGFFSVAVIQLAYPLSLLLPLLIGKGAHPGYWGYLLLGLAGIALSVIVAVSRIALEFGKDAILDSVAGAILILSFAAMAILFAVALALVVAFWKGV